MMTFITTAGETFTGHDLAALIRREGRLGTREYMDLVTGYRCASGVIYDFQPGKKYSPVRFWIAPMPERVYQGFYGSAYVTDNDLFEGTPEERAEYMALRFEALDEGATP